jgi:hypothetical protein
VIVPTFRNCPIRITFHRHALAAILLHGTGGGRRAIACATSLALALAPGPDTAQVPRGAIVARVVGRA